MNSSEVIGRINGPGEDTAKKKKDGDKRKEKQPKKKEGKGSSKEEKKSKSKEKNKSEKEKMIQKEELAIDEGIETNGVIESDGGQKDDHIEEDLPSNTEQVGNLILC